jgi:hypothetical protein
VRALRVVTIVLALACVSCQTTGMAFTRNEQIAVTRPRPRQELRLPIAVRWRVAPGLAASIRRSHGDKYYAVFVDRSPIRGGNDISGIVDSECRRTPGCGDEQWFNERGVYFTSETSITVADLPDLREDRAREHRDLHRLTVVVMQRAEEPNLETIVDGTRDGEGAVSVDFWIDRRGVD